jgi:hypothetical protein
MKLYLYHVRGGRKYQKALELMLDEDGHFMNYLYDDDVGKRGWEL